MIRLRALLYLSLCAVLAAVSQGQQPTTSPRDGASIHGFTYDAVSADKIDATITLQDLSRRTIKRVFSQKGEYSFKDVPEGSYYLHAEYFNHVPQDYGQFGPDYPPQELRVGLNATVEIAFMLEPAAAISGTLSDPDGHIVQNAEVQLLVVRYDHAGNRFLSSLTTVPPVRVSRLGAYSFPAVPAGKYYIRAAVALPAPRQGVLTPVNYNVRTYYPGVKEIDQAATIDMLRTARNIPNVNFFFRDLSEFKVTGKIVFPSLGKVKEPLFFLLTPRGNLYPRTYDPPQPTADFDDVKDRFELRNVSPGIYDLYIASVTDYAPTSDGEPNSPGFIARMPIEVKNEDIVDLIADLKPGVDLHGKFKVDGSTLSPKINFSGTKPVFVPQDGKPWALAPAATANPLNLVKPDGSFEVIHAGSGEYRIGVLLSNELKDLYLADAWLGPRRIMGQKFEVDEKTDDPLVLELRSDGARFEGTVTDADNVKANAVVVLVPPAEFRDDSGTSKYVHTDAEGHFSIGGIRPGLYTVYAFPKIESDAWLNDEFMSEYRAYGLQINFAKGTQVYRDFKTVPMQK
jgi:hypothetical protein